MNFNLKRLLFIGCAHVLFIFYSCNDTSDLKLVDWEKAEMYQLPQQVIDFYYTAEDNPKYFFVVMDSTFKVDANTKIVSHFTETHYTIHINNKALQIRERDFRVPFLIFNGKLYFSKSRILKGKLSTPQDLYIYYVDLNKVLK